MFLVFFSLEVGNLAKEEGKKMQYLILMIITVSMLVFLFFLSFNELPELSLGDVLESDCVSNSSAVV